MRTVALIFTVFFGPAAAAQGAITPAMFAVGVEGSVSSRGAIPGPAIPAARLGVMAGPLGASVSVAGVDGDVGVGIGLEGYLARQRRGAAEMTLIAGVTIGLGAAPTATTVTPTLRAATRVLDRREAAIVPQVAVGKAFVVTQAHGRRAPSATVFGAGVSIVAGQEDFRLVITPGLSYVASGRGSLALGISLGLVFGGGG